MGLESTPALSIQHSVSLLHRPIHEPSLVDPVGEPGPSAGDAVVKTHDAVDGDRAGW
jgi:hypothetical protein